MMGLNRWIAKAPTTNLRLLVGLCMSVFFVVFLAVAIVFSKVKNEDFELLVLLGSFILVEQGLNITQFGIKRGTFTPEAHDFPVREDVQPPKEPPTPELPVDAEVITPIVDQPSDPPSRALRPEEAP